MEESRTIIVHVHFADLLGSKELQVNPDEPVDVLRQKFSNVDFYFQGDRLDSTRTFRESGIESGMRLQTYKKGKSCGAFDIYFQFQDGNKLKLFVQYVWTFRRAAMELSKLTGLDVDLMRFVFAGRSLNMDYAFMNDSCMQKESRIIVVMAAPKDA